MVRALLTGAIALTESKKRADPFGGTQQGISPIAHEARNRAIALKTLRGSRMEKRGDCATKTFLLPNRR